MLQYFRLLFCCSHLVNQEAKLDFKAKLLLKGGVPFQADTAWEVKWQRVSLLASYCST